MQVEPGKEERQKEVITLKEQLLKSGLTKEVAGTACKRMAWFLWWGRAFSSG